MSAEFVDELPPGLPNTWDRSRQLAKFAAELRENPSRWAKYPLPISASSTGTRASNIRHGQMPAFKEGTFEAAVRDGVLYVRAVNA